MGAVIAPPTGQVTGSLAQLVSWIREQDSASCAESTTCGVTNKQQAWFLTFLPFRATVQPESATVSAAAQAVEALAKWGN